MVAERKFKVILADSETVLETEVSTSDRVQDLVDELKKLKSTSVRRRLRLVAAGQELRPEMLIAEVPGDTLHCFESILAPQLGRIPPKTNKSQTCFEWLESLEPGAVLLAICAMVLSCFWGLFMCKAELFGEGNVALLTVLTVAFLFPCLSFFLSGTVPVRDDMSPGSAGSLDGDYTRRRGAFGDAETPPRPRAPLQPAY